MLDMSGGRSLLSVIHEYMKLVIVPALAKTQWGQVEAKQRREFTSGINSFIGFLESEHAATLFICTLLLLPSELIRS